MRAKLASLLRRLGLRWLADKVSPNGGGGPGGGTTPR